MLKITTKAGLFIWIFIYILLTVLLGMIIVLSITCPQNNLFPWQMAIGTALGTLLFICAFAFWEKIPYESLKRSSLLYVMLLIIFGAALYIISCIGRNSPDSLVDYAQIWNAATELSEGRALTSEFYFLNYANNIKPTLYLSTLFTISRFLRFQDPFYFILIESVCQVLGAAWSVGIIAGNSREEREKYRIPVLFLFVCTLPVWANVQALYPDSMSFMMGIMALALIRLGFEVTSRWKATFLLILAGISAGAGISIKVTIFIPIIAGFIVFCSCHQPLRKWGYIGLFTLSVIAVLGLTNLLAERYEIWNMAKETSDPVINWIALGMKGDGSYFANREYVAYTHSLSTKSEKTDYALRYILENHREFWNISHLIQKIRYNFASGHLGAKDYTYFALKDHNLLWELFAPYGKYYWRTSQLCFCYIFSIYSTWMLGAVATLRHLTKKRDIPTAKAIADLSMLGIIIFLMIWEANNRQLYNQIPVIILGAVMNARQITSLKASAFNNAGSGGKSLK